MPIRSAYTAKRTASPSWCHAGRRSRSACARIGSSPSTVARTLRLRASTRVRMPRRRWRRRRRGSQASSLGCGSLDALAVPAASSAIQRRVAPAAAPPLVARARAVLLEHVLFTSPTAWRAVACLAFPSGFRTAGIRCSTPTSSPVGEVKPLKYLGRDLVAFRGEDGRARVLDAFCAHLGAHLGVGGTVVGNAVRCPFHAWCWDGDGNCVEVPYAKKIPAEGADAVVARPRAQRHHLRLAPRPGRAARLRDPRDRRLGRSPQFTLEWQKYAGR